MNESVSSGPFTPEEMDQTITVSFLRDVSRDVTNFFQLICYGIVIPMISIFGIGTNIINMICFVKQGLKDPVNVSLLGLAVSDTGCLVTMMWVSVLYIPHFQEADLPIDPSAILYLTAAMPHLVFTRATCCITALIMLERCLCIAMPLKVNTILSPNRITTIIACIYILLICSVSPLYFAGRFDMVHYPERNISRIGLLFIIEQAFLEQIVFPINNVFLPFTSLLIIIICMIIIAIALRKQSKWRMKSLKSTASKDKYIRDKKIAKMVIIISSLFVICFAPSAIMFIAIVVEPEFFYDGQLKNLFVISYSCTCVFESLNSSLNIFVYYRMSSKYRLFIIKTFSKMKYGNNE